MRRRPNFEVNKFYEVLSGKLQDRYAESGTLQVHPDYVFDPTLAVHYGDPRETRAAIQGVYLVRWAGVNGKDVRTLNSDTKVPNLSNINGEKVPYSELEPAHTFDLLESLGLITLTSDIATPSNVLCRRLLQYKNQRFTVLPPIRRLPGLFPLRDGIKALRIYQEHDYGSGVHIPYGKTTSTPQVDARRRSLRVIQGEKNQDSSE